MTSQERPNPSNPANPGHQPYLSPDPKAAACRQEVLQSLTQVAQTMTWELLGLSSGDHASSEAGRTLWLDDGATSMPYDYDFLVKKQPDPSNPGHQPQPEVAVDPEAMQPPTEETVQALLGLVTEKSSGGVSLS